VYSTPSCVVTGSPDVNFVRILDDVWLDVQLDVGCLRVQSTKVAHATITSWMVWAFIAQLSLSTNAQRNGKDLQQAHCQ